MVFLAGEVAGYLMVHSINRWGIRSQDDGESHVDFVLRGGLALSGLRADAVGSEDIVEHHFQAK